MLSPLRTNCLPHLADVAKPIWGDPTEVQHSVWWLLSEHKRVRHGIEQISLVKMAHGNSVWCFLTLRSSP